MRMRSAYAASASVPRPANDAALRAPIWGQKRSVSTPLLAWNDKKRFCGWLSCACRGPAPMLSSRGSPTETPARPRRKVLRLRKRALLMRSLSAREVGERGALRHADHHVTRSEVVGREPLREGGQRAEIQPCLVACVRVLEPVLCIAGADP